MSNRASPHVQTYGAYDQGGMVTRENQYPDRFGQSTVSFEAELDDVPPPPAEPLAALQAQINEVRDLAARLTAMHSARKAVAVSASRDAAYHRAQSRAREATTVASLTIRRAQSGTPQTWALRQASTSLATVASLMQSLLAHPTGRTA